MLGVGTSCFVFALLVRWHYESSKSGSIEVPMFFTFFMGFLSVALVTIKLSFFTSALILWTFWVFQVVGASRGYRSIANHAFFWVLGASVSILSYLILFVLPYVSSPLKFSAPIFPGSFPGYDSFYEYLKDWRDSNFPFPFSLVVSDSLGHFTTALGPVTIGVLLSLKSFQTWSGAQKLGVLYASLLVMLNLLLGQLNARFFYESYLWILIALAAGRCFYFDRLTRWISRTQAAVFIVVGLTFFIPNSGSLFSNVARDEFWRDHSNGYSLGRDLMSVDYSDSQILTNVRSRASLPFDTISGDWLRFSDSPFDIEYYKSEVLDLTDESFLFVDHSRIGISQFLSLCPGNVLGVFSYKPAFRNPFNARPLGIESYLTKPSSWDSCRLALLMNKRK